MRFDEWLANFTKDKKELPLPDQTSPYAIHTIRRFIDLEKHVWEMACTYTGRVVVRSGRIEPDGLNITWTEWETRHDIDLSKSPPK